MKLEESGEEIDFVLSVSDVTEIGVRCAWEEGRGRGGGREGRGGRDEGGDGGRRGRGRREKRRGGSLTFHFQDQSHGSR
jgi:hypothetical protein